MALNVPKHVANLLGGIITGLRAITVQSYSEANSKNGLQFYTRLSWPKADEIPSGETRNIIFKTTTKNALAKVRIVHYSAEEVELNIIKGVEVTTPGTAITPSNYSGVNAAVTTVELQKDAVFTGGTPIDPEPEYYFGSSASGQRTGDSIPEGRERVLPTVETYAITIKNTGTGTARVQYYLDWYEGAPDLPAVE